MTKILSGNQSAAIQITTGRIMARLREDYPSLLAGADAPLSRAFCQTIEDGLREAANLGVNIDIDLSKMSIDPTTEPEKPYIKR